MPEWYRIDVLKWIRLPHELSYVGNINQLDTKHRYHSLNGAPTSQQIFGSIIKNKKKKIDETKVCELAFHKMKTVHFIQKLRKFKDERKTR